VSLPLLSLLLPTSREKESFSGGGGGGGGVFFGFTTHFTNDPRMRRYRPRCLPSFFFLLFSICKVDALHGVSRAAHRRKGAGYSSLLGRKEAARLSFFSPLLLPPCPTTTRPGSSLDLSPFLSRLGAYMRLGRPRIHPFCLFPPSHTAGRNDSPAVCGTRLLAAAPLPPLPSRFARTWKLV